MAYNKKRLFEQAKEAITQNNLFFIEDIVAFIPCDRATFYRLFPPECDKCDTLKGLLEQNRVRTKTAIRAKLFKSPKAAELLSLYRLICSPEERRLLNQNYLEITGKDGVPINQSIKVEVIDRREDVRHNDTDNTDI